MGTYLARACKTPVKQGVYNARTGIGIAPGIDATRGQDEAPKTQTGEQE